LDADLYKFGKIVKNESKFIAIPTTTQINMANLWHLKLGYIKKKHTQKHTNSSKRS
jgi:hypothetical protein